MKTRLTITALAIAGALILAGCKTESTVVSAPEINENDVADMIAGSLGGSASTNGVSSQIEEAASLAAGGSLGMRGESEPSFDTTFVRARSIGPYSYYYVFHYSIGFSDLVNRLDFAYTMKGVYDTPRLSSDDSASAAFTLTQILAPDSQYTVNATYTRRGSQTSKVRNRNRFTSLISVTLDSLKVSKATGRIQAGSASVAVSGTKFDEWVGDGRMPKGRKIDGSFGMCVRFATPGNAYAMASQARSTHLTRWSHDQNDVKILRLRPRSQWQRALLRSQAWAQKH